MKDLLVLHMWFVMIIALSIAQQEEAMANNSLSCAFTYLAENKYTNCQRKNITDFSECGVENCTDNQYLCYSIYKYINGVLEPHIIGCNYRNRKLASQQCTKDKCVLYKSHVKSIYECCCYGNFCNRNIIRSIIDEQNMTTTSTPIITTSNSTTYLPNTSIQMINKLNKNENMDALLYCLIPLFLTILLITVIMLYYRKCKQIHIHRRNNALLMTQVEPTASPLLAMNYQFEVLQMLHQGHFGHVKKCRYQEKIVAIKYVKHRMLWETEKEVYQHCLLGNKNILNFIAALNNDLHREFYIITEYHQHGTLVDFLKRYTLTLDKLLTFLENITNALSFLHNSCVDTKKPSIAHRDLKSSNVFVREDWTCCIGDFGLALSLHHGAEAAPSYPDIQQVGTKRYMAPEVLEGSIAFCWESFLQADVYSLSLVMWEIVSRCNVDTVVCEDYQYVYHDVIGSNPNVQEIEKCVCEKKKRPVIKDKWKSNTILAGVCETMTDAWDEDPFARITASCAHRRILTLQQQYQEEELNTSDVVSMGSIRDERTSSSSSALSEEHIVLIHPRL